MNCDGCGNLIPYGAKYHFFDIEPKERYCNSCCDGIAAHNPGAEMKHDVCLEIPSQETLFHLS